MTHTVRRLFAAGAVMTLGLSAAACSSSSSTPGASSSSSTSSSSSSSSTGSSSSSGSVPAVDSGGVSGLTVDVFTKTGPSPAYAALAALKPVASTGSGKIAVLLPDTQSSNRYTTQDEPDLKKAFESAGLTSSDYSIVNAQGDASTQQTQAQQAMQNGAKVIILDALDSGTGAKIESDAKTSGVKVIDYDRLVLNGSASYYVSFDNVQVGKLQGNGLVQCISDWGVSKPNVFELDGSPDDNNATLFAQGYNSVLKPKYDSNAYTKVGEEAVPGWDNQKGQTMFQQAYQAHSNINAVLVANDGLDQGVITVLKNAGIKPKTVPTTGQDASTPGLQSVLAGYQCGTVYKPIYGEAAATAALAILLRSGVTPPKALVNGATNNKVADVPSVLLTPVWVTAANMKDTVIKDQFVSPSDLCTADVAAACKSAGITS